MRFIESIEAYLLDQGYERKAPTPEVEKIDSALARISACFKCRTVGMNYVPFTRSKSYRAYMVCPICGWVGEF